MKVILKETIDSLGIIGSEVQVADGYARNYLLPQDKAVAATPANRKLLAQQKMKFELQIAKERAQAEEMAQQVEGITCTIAAKVSDGDKLYGSVTVRDIVTALQKQGVTIEKRMLLLNDPIKTLGAHKVAVRIYKGVKPEITVEIVPE
ncbi:MAG: 50S ribosomal protein L9 [Desulfobacterales bacterium]|nr:50S ribosomal protein L9 [Desulfobacterales bacterium]